MRRAPKVLKAFKVFAATLYLVLSMAAAWHIHHVEQADPHASARISAASQTGAPADLDGFCALCSWQSLQQETASAVPAAAVFQALVTASKSPAFAEPAPGFSQAAWARGPPSV